MCSLFCSSLVNPNFHFITFKLGTSAVWKNGPKVHGDSCAPTLELFVQLRKLMIRLTEYELIRCHSSCFDAACHPPHLYYHHSETYLPLALGICWHGGTHTISAALAPAAELMFASLGLIKLRRTVNTVSSRTLAVDSLMKKSCHSWFSFFLVLFLFVCATWLALLYLFVLSSFSCAVARTQVAASC